MDGGLAIFSILTLVASSNFSPSPSKELAVDMGLFG